MAAIGAIRKHGVLLMVVIGFALVLFLLTGLFDGNTLYRVFASDQYTMGKIDGENVDESYRTLYEQNTLLMRVLQNKSTFSEAENYQIHQITWEQLIYENIFDTQMKKLGIVFHQELTENMIEEAKLSLSTEQPHPYISAYAQYLVPMIGIDNVMSFITNAEEYQHYEWARDLYNAYKAIERRIIFEEKLNTYFAFAQGIFYYSEPLAQKFAEDNRTAKASLVSFNPIATAFNEISVDVTEKEMKDYYNKNKNKYSIKENMRDIDVAIFPITPTVEDKAEIEQNVRKQFESFSTASMIDSFNMAAMYNPVDSSFYKKGSPIIINTPNGYLSMQTDVLDSLIFDRPVGTIIEPYNWEDNTWFFGKSFGAELRPDSIYVAALVVDFKSNQNPDATRTKKQSRSLVDSLKNVISAGITSIFTLTPNYLGGRQAADSLMWYADNATPYNLYNGLLHTPQGGLYVDELPTAFVIYQVMNITMPIAKRQYALYAFDIKASDQTINTIRSNASLLAASSTTAEQLVEEANNNGIQLVNGTDITSMMSSISHLQECRPIVSWAFSNKMNVNDISDVFKLDDRMFAVAAIKNIKEKGVAEFNTVKDDISAELSTIKKKEAVQALIQGEVNSGASLSDIAAKYSVAFNDSIRISFSGEPYQNSGIENIAIGKIFANETLNQPQVISGKNMVYLVSLHSVEATPASNNLMLEKNMLQNMLIGRSRNEMLILEGLKEKLDIFDNRTRFYLN